MDDPMKTPDKSREQEIDRWLDDALSQYSKVDPRDGLEGRVLARLAEARREPSRKLHWWGALAFTTAAILAIALLWHAHTESTQFRQTPAAKVIAPAKEGHAADSEPALDEKPNHASRDLRPLSVAQSKSHRRADVTQPTALPKLEQFPSPQPLNQQEQILMSYVANYPRSAALVAEARAVALERDRQEEAAEAAKGTME